MVNKLFSTDPIFFPIPTSTTWIGNVNFKLFPIQCYRRCRIFPHTRRHWIKTISIRQAARGKIAWAVLLECVLPVSHVSSLLLWWTRLSLLFQRVQWNSPTTPSFLLQSFEYHTIIYGKKMTSQTWRIKHSHLVIPLNCFVSLWPTWSFNIVERSNFFLSVFLLEVNATKKLPLSWKDIKDLLSTAPNNWFHSLKIWPKCAGWGSIDKSCVTLTYLRWFKHE